MSRYPSPSDNSWHRAAPGVHPAKAVRLFFFLALLLSLVGGSAISAGAAGATSFSGTELLADPITYIGDIGSGMIKDSSNNNLVITTTAAVEAGDAIVIAYVSDPYQNVQISVADSAGNTYTQVALAINTGNARTYLFVDYGSEMLPSGSTITITQGGITGTGPAARAAVVSVFRGLAAANALDRTSTGTGSSTTPSSGPTATTSVADELLIGVIGTEGPDGDAAGTWGDSFTAGPRKGTTGGSDPATDITVALGWRIVSATGVYTAQKSGITARDWAAIIATFKSATAGPTPAIFNILLGRPEDHSVSANIIPDQDVDFYVEYGTSSGVYTGQTSTYSATADEPIEILIGGLSANQHYFYRLVSRVTGTTGWNEGAESSFDTQKAPGETFTFTIVSDSHLGQYGGQTTNEKALYQQTMLNVAADQPDFHLDLGDTFAMDPSPLGTGMTDAEAKAAYLVQRPYWGLIGPSVPILLALGNHENEEGWNWDDVFTAPDQSLARVGIKYRKLYYPNPVPDTFYSGNTDPLPVAIGGDTLRQDYYAWQWGDVLFVVLDPYHYSMTWPAEGGTYGGEGMDGEAGGDRWDWTLGIKQYLWLKDTLENSDATHKFVFSHHVTGGSTPYGRGGIGAASLFEWGGYNADGITWGWDTERPAAAGWDVPIHQLMVANGVDVFFHGHDHIYANEELDGIVYLECAKPDDAGYAWEPYGYGHTEGLYPNGDELQNSGHIRVTVSPAQATIQYVRAYLPADGANGQVARTTIVAAKKASVNVTITKPSSHLALTWPHWAAAVDHYAVYRSATAPYFAPDAGAWQADVPAPSGTPPIDVLFPDPEVDLSVAGTSYFYVVTPMNAGNEPIGSSNRTGVFVFGLTPGSGP